MYKIQTSMLLLENTEIVMCNNCPTLRIDVRIH